MVYFLPLLYLKDEGYSIETIEKLDKEFLKISNTTKKEFGIRQIADKLDMDELDTFKLISLCIQKKLAIMIYKGRCPECHKFVLEIDHIDNEKFNFKCPRCDNNITINEKDLFFTIKLLLGSTKLGGR